MAFKSVLVIGALQDLPAAPLSSPTQFLSYALDTVFDAESQTLTHKSEFFIPNFLLAAYRKNPFV